MFASETRVQSPIQTRTPRTHFWIGFLGLRTESMESTTSDRYSSFWNLKKKLVQFYISQILKQNPEKSSPKLEQNFLDSDTIWNSCSESFVLLIRITIFPGVRAAILARMENTGNNEQCELPTTNLLDQAIYRWH